MPSKMKGMRALERIILFKTKEEAKQRAKQYPGTTKIIRHGDGYILEVTKRL